MREWRDGYVGEIDYTFGYHEEMNPQRVKLAFLHAGLVSPEIKVACELGFGQGLTVNFLAAAGGADWYGTDFNPSQAGFAQELAGCSDTNVNLRDDSFQDFCRREELPEFDYIALHGIWSWISDKNRAVIVDFVGRKLKPGGVLYISYNTLPGWSGFMPLRNLMVEHTRSLGVMGQGIGERIKGAINYAQELLQSESMYGKANPLVIERVKQIASQNPEYLAHEYFNQDWKPLDFQEMATWLQPAKMDFACSATYFDHVYGLRLTAPQRELIESIPDRMLREGTLDLLVNQAFRRDFWVKGKRKVNPLQQSEALRSSRLILSRPAEDIEYKVKTGVGEANLTKDIYQPIVEIMSDHGVMSVGELAEKLKEKEKDITMPLLFEAVMVLVGAEHMALAREPADIASAETRTQQLNSELMQRALGSAEINYLCSPLLGGAVKSDRFEMMFLHALQEGHKKPKQWAEYAWSILASQGQRVRKKEGKIIEAAEDNLAFLVESAEEFKKKRLPILKALQVV